MALNITKATSALLSTEASKPLAERESRYSLQLGNEISVHGKGSEFEVHFGWLTEVEKALFPEIALIAAEYLFGRGEFSSELINFRFCKNGVDLDMLSVTKAELVEV